MYKIISKVLAKRIKEVVEKVVGDLQSAFVKGKHITNWVLIANECFEDCRADGKKAVVRSWILRRLMIGLIGILWTSLWLEKDLSKVEKWIYSCISTSHFSILVNGVARGSFSFL